MAYPTVPGRKFAFDVGGGSVYRGTSNLSLASALNSDEMSKLNGISNTTYAVYQPHATNYGVKLVLWVFFPHKLNVSGLGMLHAQAYAGQFPPVNSLQAITVYGSANTTNGIDGTWLAASLPNGSIPTRLMGDDDWRDQIQPCTFSESIRCLRIEYATTGSYMGVVVYALHVYGMKAAGEVVNDILFLDDDASGDPEFLRDLDFGDRPEGTTTTHRIKLFCSSPTLTANNITLSLLDQDFLFSMDEGVSWVTGATITSLAPGTASTSIIIKNTVPPPTQMLGPRSPRIEVQIGSWS
jgi:hypothetical protein